MSIIFQLFSAKDLKDLDESQLRILRETVNVYFNPYLDITLNTTLKHPARVTPEIIAAIWNRTREVVSQLRPGATLPADPPGVNPSQPLFRQILTAQPLQSLNLTSRESDILEMAISCEVAHVNYYHHLQDVKDRVYETFDFLTGQRPQDPDTFYSPFNLNSPLNYLVNRQRQWPPP
jgi:hypothetical protein